eukprot:SAG22_NODE_60_length_23423_cov_8.445250_12_plen_115_part_00
MVAAVARTCVGWVGMVYAPAHEGSHQPGEHATIGSFRALAAAVLRLPGVPQEQRSAAPFQLASCIPAKVKTLRRLCHVPIRCRPVWLAGPFQSHFQAHAVAHACHETSLVHALY